MQVASLGRRISTPSRIIIKSFNKQQNNSESVNTELNKFIKILNLIILMLYRYGNGGFLGVGGTWNLNEEKNPDVEIIASGVFVGFFIYTSVILISYCFGTTSQKHSPVDLIMNLAGTVLWVTAGGIALHYWVGYQKEHKYTSISSEKQVGLAVGSLCVVSGAVYLLDTVLSCIHMATKLALVD